MDYVGAPSAPTPNFALIGQDPYFNHLSPGTAFLQTVGFGALGGAALSGGVAAAPAAKAILSSLKGPALGALMEFSGTTVDTNAARNVTRVILQEGYPEFLEGMEQVGALFRSLEVPEAAGSEIPWGP